MADAAEAPGDMVTTFTLHERLYGVDGNGKIWKRPANGIGWEDAGAEIKADAK